MIGLPALASSGARTFLGAWILGGLALCAPTLQDVQDGPQPPHHPNPLKKREHVDSLVKLPEGFVRFARVPDGGLRPRVAQAKDGSVSVIYYKGDASHGDLYFTRSTDDAQTFAPSVRLNPVEGSVSAVDSAPSGSIAVGPDGRAHVVWIGAGAKPTVYYACEKKKGEPVTEGRKDVASATDGQVKGEADDGHLSFAAPLELGSPPELGSSTAVMVDATGQVFVIYTALELEAEQVVPRLKKPNDDDPPIEPHHRVWMRKSMDGASFSDAVRIDRERHDVSANCALSAHADEVTGTLFVLYRCAFDTPNPNDKALARDMRLISSQDHGEEWKSALVDNWKLQRDPASGGSLTQEASTTLATWDARGHVYWAVIKRQFEKIDVPVDPKDEEREFYRSQAAGAAGAGDDGEVIVTWLERPADDRNAAPKLGWEVWQRPGRVPLERGYATEPPGNSAPVVFPHKGRGFTILY